MHTENEKKSQPSWVKKEKDKTRKVKRKKKKKVLKSCKINLCMMMNFVISRCILIFSPALEA